MYLDALRFLPAIFVFGSVCSLILCFGQWRLKKQQAVLERLDPWLEKKTVLDPAREKLSLPLGERLLKPGLKRLTQTFSRWMPSKTSDTLSQRLIRAGNPGGLSASEFVALQYALTFGLALMAVFISLFLTTKISNRISLAALCGIAGYLLPDLVLRYRVRQRQETAVNTLPDSLDLLLVSIEAGMGFDGALQKVTEKSKGMLGQEFTRLLNEVRMGKPRREALRDLSDRIGAEEFASFVGAIIQSEQLGVSMGNILRLQAGQLRQKRRQKAEEKAMKAPIKMLIPLVLFIFPTIFIVLLGPAAIQLSGTLLK